MKRHSVVEVARVVLLWGTIVLAMSARAGFCQTHTGTFKARGSASIIVP